MANTIIVKKGAGTPSPESLQEAELALDTVDGSLYSKLNDGSVVQLNDGADDVDLSDYVSKSKQNDVAEGQFRLVWDHSADPDFPFNGSIGYDGNNDDPDSVGGSFLYAKGIRGTVSIGRDGDMELHGPSEIKGMPDREDNLPWITDFAYVQAGDFLDADGNSIIGAGGDPEWADIQYNLGPDDHAFVVTTSGGLSVGPLTNLTSSTGTAIGREASSGDFGISAGFKSNAGGMHSIAFGYRASAPHTYSIALGHAAQTTKDGQLKIAQQITEVDFSSATVQAADYLDADGNSIIGAGGGGTVHIGEAPPEDPQEGQQWLETPAGGDAKMWIWDGAVWLEQPSNATGGGGSSLWTENDDGSIEYGGTVVYNDNRMSVPHVLGVGDFDGVAPYGGTIVALGDGGSTKIACKNKQHDAEAGINLETGNIHKWRIANHGLTQKLIFTTGSSTPTDGSGQVTINTDGVVEAKGYVTAPDFIATSDERAKEQISPMPVGLIDDIKPVQWTWKESGEKSAGVIAQQLQEIGLDDFVKEDENGMLGVNYNALVGVLLAEVISLKGEVKALKQ